MPFRLSLCVLFLCNAAVVDGSLNDFGTKYDRPPWYISLFWNLLGYATIIVPGALIVRAVKNSNFYERSGEFYGLPLHAYNNII